MVAVRRGGVATTTVDPALLATRLAYERALACAGPPPTKRAPDMPVHPPTKAEMIARRLHASGVAEIAPRHLAAWPTAKKRRSILVNDRYPSQYEFVWS